ncbi:MAG: hypothetical protein Barrevirus1_57 [Barrevirus sp.]|uniref:Uncharacterized protein n=1 Tax=Barrevirus sp. TaxID=2487763 RepID=A0A3G4ZPL8_9VIRU|nr:MAG: hypothetical protein Barrevirus1_57 [Barrevirus sp.]
MDKGLVHKMDSQYGINHNDSDIVKHFWYADKQKCLTILFTL